MPQVTVVPADHLIIVDGATLVFTYVAPENLHALQWRGDTGHTEWTDGPNKPLTAEDYDEQVVPYVALWEEEKRRLEAEAAAAEEAYNYFCDEMENCLPFVFGCTREIRDLAVDAADEKLLLRSTILAAANKMYLDCCFNALRQEENLWDTILPDLA